MDKLTSKEIDRRTYNSAKGGDFSHSSKSAHTMFEIEQKWMESNMPFGENKPLLKAGLEIGCGVGETLHWIKKYCAYVVGLDHSIESLRRASSNVQSLTPADIINADAEFLPLKDGHIDLVFCGSILHHLPNYQEALKALYKSLNDGGMVLATEPCAYNPFAVIRRRFFPSIFHTPEERPFPPDELIREFKVCFDRVIFKRFYIFSINAPLIEKFFGQTAAKIYLRVFHGIDDLLVHIPFIRNLCWRISIIGFKHNSKS